jgi:hypothetical protein
VPSIETPVDVHLSDRSPRARTVDIDTKPTLPKGSGSP